MYGIIVVLLSFPLNVYFALMMTKLGSTRTTFGDRSLAVDGPRVWILEQSISASLRDPTLSITVFSNRLDSSLRSIAAAFAIWNRRLFKRSNWLGGFCPGG